MAKGSKENRSNSGTGDEETGAIYYRMKDLIRESGLPRKTIHYYINEGLLPAPKKTGRNTALYGPEHLERLLQICMLRQEQFLPVKAIKAIYDDNSSADMTSEQKKFIRGLRLGLPESIRPGAEQYVKLNTVKGKITTRELNTLKQEGLIEIIGSGAAKRLSKEDAVVLESWNKLKEIGFTTEKGYDPSMLKLWDSAIEQLVVKEITSLAGGIFRDSSSDSLKVARKTMSVVRKLIEALHYKKTRIQFQKLQAEQDSN